LVTPTQTESSPEGTVKLLFLKMLKKNTCYSKHSLLW